MVNPFISVDEQLRKFYWNKYYECGLGFEFVKKWGVDVYEKAVFDGKHIVFYWPMSVVPNAPGPMNEKELELFAAKIKEWRRQYGRNTESGRHSSKKCS